MTFSRKVRASLEGGFAAVGCGFWFAKYSHTRCGGEGGETQRGEGPAWVHAADSNPALSQFTGHLQTADPPSPLGEHSGTTCLPLPPL